MTITINSSNNEKWENLAHEYLSFRNVQIDDSIDVRIFIYKTRKQYQLQTKNSNRSNGCMQEINSKLYLIWMHEENNDKNDLFYYECNKYITFFHELDHVIQYTSKMKNIIYYIDKYRQDACWDEESYLYSPLEIGARYYSRLGFRFVFGYIGYEEDVLEYYKKYLKFSIWELESLKEEIINQIWFFKDFNNKSNHLKVLDYSVTLVSVLIKQYKQL